MLRVLWVSHFLPYPPTGGVLQRGFGLISRLSRSCEVHLLTMHQPRLFRQTGGKTPADKTAAIGELRKLCASVETVDIPSETHVLGRPLAALHAGLTGRSYTEQWLASSAMARAVARVSGALRPDLAHFDTISLAPYSRHCDRSSRVSLGHHNIESHMMWRRAKTAGDGLKQRLLHIEAGRILQLERTYGPRADLNVVCSELDGLRLRRLTGATQIHVAENGVMDPEIDAGRLAVTSLPARRLLFIGRMSAYTNKDAAEFLSREIWPTIAQRHPDISLDIVGSGAPQAALDLAESDRRVRVHGFVRDLTSLLAPDCIFVCPVRDGGGTKLKILDAMNRGLPIVAHPTALEGIDAQHGQHVLLAETAQQFADAVASLLASPVQCATLARNAFELVRERYAFDSIAARLADRFASIAFQPRTA